ncbi:uncharacterized protein LOC112692476 [Sipha flava]|uniref:Uncharacterized protein LOC112692476 n=1 Tax=Sipha flava TaxID=143950 RepID=A0A8B8GK15_9HEMI|nr:uncharacterized protein LOC112692476 [Sipha flava]
MTVWVKVKFFDIVFLILHAPTEEKSQEKKEEFYKKLENILSRINNSKIRIMLGMHSLHETTNNNGMKLTDLATCKGFKIISTIFPHNDINKMNKRFMNNVNDVRVYRGADYDPDHYLVGGKFNIKLKTRQQIDSSYYVKYEITKLKNEEICRVF